MNTVIYFLMMTSLVFSSSQDFNKSFDCKYESQQIESSFIVPSKFNMEICPLALKITTTLTGNSMFAPDLIPNIILHLHSEDTDVCIYTGAYDYKREAKIICDVKQSPQVEQY